MIGYVLDGSWNALRHIQDTLEECIHVGHRSWLLASHGGNGNAADCHLLECLILLFLLFLRFRTRIYQNLVLLVIVLDLNLLLISLEWKVSEGYLYSLKSKGFGLAFSLLLIFCYRIVDYVAFFIENKNNYVNLLSMCGIYRYILIIYI